MRTFTLDGKERVIDCNALTPFIYAEEFRTTGSNGKQRGEDINECVMRVWDMLETDGVPPMLDLLRLLWAFERTAGNKRDVPRFETWLHNQPSGILALDIDAEGSWAKAVIEQLTESFFPTSASADVETAEQ